MVRFKKLTAVAVKALSPGDCIREQGIVAEKTSTGDVRWTVNVMVDGVRIHRVIGRTSDGTTRTKAEEAIETLRTRAREDRLGLPKGRKTHLSFADGVEAYLARLAVEGGKAIERKGKHLRGRLATAFAGRRLDQIGETEGRAYAARRQAEGAKPATINRELATLSHMLRCCAKWGMIGGGRLPYIPKLTESGGRTVVLSSAEIAALLQGAKEDSDADLWLFVSICLQTSMRHGEACRLRWEHFDAHRQRFYIPEAKAGQRDQPLPAQLVELLCHLRPSENASGYLFAGGPGSSTGYRHTFRKAFRRAVTRAGLDASQVTPHVMRHTAITRLVKAGVDLPTIQKVSGHKTLSMVLRYAHVDGPHIDSAVAHLAI